MGRSCPGPAHRLAFLSLLVVVVLAGGPSQAQDGGRVDGQSLREEYEALAGEEAQALADYDVTTLRLEELTGRVEDAARGVVAAGEALVRAEADLAVHRESEEQAVVALDQARDRVESAEDRLRAHAVEAYMGEDAAALGRFVDVLTGDDTAAARRGYRGSVSEQQENLVAELAEARETADLRSDEATAARQRSQDQRDGVERLREEATAALAEQARLQRETADQQALQSLLISHIRSRKVSIEARLVSLEQAADGVAQVLAAFQAGDPDWEAGAIDVSSPAPGFAIGSEFGPRSHPILGITRLHAGCDIGAPSGTPVLAAADGVVLLAEERGGYGLTVVVAHEYSLGTVYAHNSSLSVAVGDQVLQGDEVAKVGSTGLSTGPHIHFETRIRGVPVNPRDIFTRPDGAPPR